MWPGDLFWPMKWGQKDRASHLGRSMKSQCWGHHGSKCGCGVTRVRSAPAGPMGRYCKSAIRSAVWSHWDWNFCHGSTASPNLTAYDLSKDPRFSYDHYDFCHIWKPPMLLLNIFLTSTHWFSFRFILEGNVISTQWNTSIINRKQWEINGMK